LVFCLIIASMFCTSPNACRCDSPNDRSKRNAFRYVQNILAIIGQKTTTTQK